MKVFRPSEEEFAQPLEYIENLYNSGAYEYGCVKIIPPASFKPECAFDMGSSLKIPTRK